MAVIVFEVIPMKNMMSISTKQEEEHMVAVLGSGGISTMLMEEIGGKKAPSTNARNSGNSKMKLTHQGFRIEEDVVKLLAREANNRQISVSSLVNIILKTHVTYRKQLDELGFIPVSKDFLRKVFSAIPQKEAEEVGRSLGFSIS